MPPPAELTPRTAQGRGFGNGRLRRLTAATPSEPDTPGRARGDLQGTDVMTKTLRAVSVGLVAMLACAACGAPQTADVGDPIGGHLARIQIAAHVCLGIRPFLTKRAFPADWPEGSETDAKAGVLRGPAGQVVARVGQPIASVGIFSKKPAVCSSHGYAFHLQD